jgi:hypothetical protein
MCIKKLQYAFLRFVEITAVVVLAAGALYAFLSLLPAVQTQPVLAQGSGTGTIIHTTVSDFNAAGSVLTDTTVSSANGGEVRLVAYLEDYFDDPAVDAAKWITVIENSGNPKPIVGNGIYTTSNGGIRSVITVPVAGRVIDFRARFWQPGESPGWGDVGFGRTARPGGSTPDEANRMFITNGWQEQPPNVLRANARDGAPDPDNQDLTGYDFSQFHVYRIEWDTDETRYYVDGNLEHTQGWDSLFTPYVWAAYTIEANRPVEVDWVRVSYYPTMSGQYKSNTVNSGQFDSHWTTLEWAPSTQPGGSMSIETRTSNDGTTWSAWTSLGSGNTVLSLNGQYLQYRITLNTTDVNVSPEIDSVTVSYSNVPTADPGGSYSASEGVPLTLNGSGSADPNGDPLTYTWDLDYDGSFNGEATGVTPTVSFPDGPDLRTIALLVHDGEFTDVQTTTVVVNNVAPIIDPGGPYYAGPGDVVAFTVSITDVPADSHTIEWDLDFDSSYEKSGQTVTRTFEAEGTYQVRVKVTDDDGASASEVAQVFIKNYRVYLPITVRNFDGSGQ